VIPVYNERDNLAPLLGEVGDACADLDYEVIAVDDGSGDGSLDELRYLAAADRRIRVVALRRNAGQSAALAAGWDAARGDIVVTMDADGQNDPADLRDLLAPLADGACTASVGIRVHRRDSASKRIQSRVANAFRNWLTGDRIQDTGCGLKAIRREPLVSLPRFDGMHRFLPTLLRNSGGQVVEVPVSHRPRRHGRSKYGMWNRVFRGVRDALGVRWLRQRALQYDVTEEAS
jgi:dolichol-phosphate mannosyltransferase